MMTEPSDETEALAGEESVWSAASAEPDLESSDLDVVFRRQPRPVVARHRVAYRTAILVLALSRFNKGAAKLANLHTLMWAMRTARTRQLFAAWWSGRRFYFTETDRLDPDLQITLNLALVDGLIRSIRAGARVQLSEKGLALAARINESDALLVVEKEFLSKLERLNDASMERRLAREST